ncbi:MAG: hypothetical protein MJZ65_02920 [Paludibacteraceae bacterium]|nr:hypothetical protein [Paludibacteraceae bacterium]
MAKITKIGITVVCVICVGVFVLICLNQWFTTLVKRQLDTNIAAADSVCIRYGNVHLSVFTGEARIENVYFCSDTLPFADTITRNAIEAKVDIVSLDGINYYDWLVRRQLHLKGLTVKRPTITSRFEHNRTKDKGQLLESELRQKQQERLQQVLTIARIFLDDALITRITIDRAYVDALAYNDSLHVLVPECTMSVYDLGYNIRDEVPHYNDSVFHFLFRDVRCYIPDAHLTLTLDRVQASPNGVIEVKNMQAQTYLDTLLLEPIVAGVDSIRVGGFDVAKFNTLKLMEIKNIHLYNAFARMCVNELNEPDAHTQRTTRQEVQGINQKLQQANMEATLQFITGLDVDTLHIHNASVDVRSVATAFSVHADSLSLAVYGLGYSLIDEIPYHYNDSVYQFRLGYADIITPDSLVQISTSDIRYNDGGFFSMNRTHIRHIVDRWDLAHRMGDIPSTWVDMVVRSVRTSSKNIVKEAFSLENGFYLDTLYADIESLSVFRDSRYDTPEPYHLPQSYLLDLTYPFVIRRVNASIAHTHINLAMTKQSVGQLDLGPIAVQVNNVTAIPNSTIHILARCQVGKGKANARFDMTVNPACDWHLTLHSKQLDLHFLDGLLYPIVGMKIGCDVAQLDADYRGNSVVANGTFCMQYDNLSVRAFKDTNSPFAIVENMSGLINSAGKTILNRSNPSRSNRAPLSYYVQWKNDVWQNPSLFYCGPVIDGCIKTLLPGLFLHKRVKS